MIRLTLITILFLLSLLTIFKAPTNLLWYVSILVTEFCWVFFTVVAVLILWPFGEIKYKAVSLTMGVLSLVTFAIPVIDAYRAAPAIEKMFKAGSHPLADTGARASPYSFSRMLTRMNAPQVEYTTLTYDSANGLTLDFYAAVAPGKKPCVMVVHGGSWAGGDSRQLPELNSTLAKEGYPVATINYRLAPRNRYPAPLEDIKAALTYLRTHAIALGIASSKFVLLGRSAGGQIVLSAGYTLNDPSIKGVISFYGPSDMVWGYANPANPLVIDSRKVMSDYLGGSYSEVPQQYINSSATETATAKAVPTLLIHGENDPLVSHLHAVRLGRKLDSLGTKHYDIYLPWATHGFDWTLNGPAGQLSTWCVMRFLAQVDN